MRNGMLVLLLAATLAAPACEAGDQAGDAPPPEPASQPQPTRTAPDLPDTTAPAVWAYLREATYPDSWRLWPGKGRLYEGTEPHGMLLTTYLNDRAYDALTGDTGPLPVGSIIVKENYTPDSTLAAVTVMYAADGYDPDHNDYFWAKYTPDGGVDAAGRVESCQSCHAAGERGYLRTTLESDTGEDGT